MRYALKDYQLAAVRQVLAQLETAHDLYRKSQLTSQFSLSAATGSGKTVMAAAVIEALFSATKTWISCGTRRGSVVVLR